MKIYQDIFSGTEVISDSYPSVEIHDGVALEVKARYVVKGEENIDIGCGNAFSNPDAAEEEVNQNVEKVIDLVDAFNYQESPFGKADYAKYIKSYMKKVLDHLTANKPNRVDTFKKGAQALVGFIMANFDEFTFYTPSDYDNDNIIILSYYKNKDDEAPTFIYFMDGLKFYKV